MAYIYNLTEGKQGVIFFGCKCGTTMLRQNIHYESGYGMNEYNPPYAQANNSHVQYKNLVCKDNLNLPMYLLVRHPIKRFISGFWHQWRHWEEEFFDTRDYINSRIGKRIKRYTFEVHMELVKQYDDPDLVKPNEWQKVAFYEHCVHDLGDEYELGMQIIRLGNIYGSKNKFLEPLLNRKNRPINSMYDDSNNYDYPKLIISDTHLEYIQNKFKKSIERFGYTNDYRNFI